MRSSKTTAESRLAAEKANASRQVDEPEYEMEGWVTVDHTDRFVRYAPRALPFFDDSEALFWPMRAAIGMGDVAGVHGHIDSRPCWRCTREIASNACSLSMPNVLERRQRMV